ncbi:MAG: bifunctional 5,10-methylene-tetrahydrofolate dehydrogenase/5,10-methylene-tetrahydrofolate cyclohydrolase [Bacteroidales bacterium]|nr:bifunctional 5,10-methylene-tetrahydrofolate dehydrogenase/5,10-methylene-tetrahydrofolate cyclohydrolase [Bacteroidales bacterium]MBR1850718.1 bifunctional 5,10-methylene-tetrahydrofolate dehydrogenase/5,10-methylene-tetrahydrofolate cyclohydrolase [Bacteroidales bacterium]
MTQLLDGKALSIEIKNEIANTVRRLTDAGHRPPHLAAVLVGNDGASMTYVANKEKSSHEVGFVSSVYRLAENTTEQELLATINFLNNDPEIDGFIVQLPLPKHINEQNVINTIAPQKDIDGFTPLNIGNMVLGRPCFTPATPLGISTLLHRNGIATEGKHCVIVGRSNIVGTPLANLMSRNRETANCTVTLCHSRTANLASLTRQADILVVAIGQPEFIGPEMVKEGAVLVDVGIHRLPDASRKSGYRIVGDVRHSEVDPLCSWVTPVPGGVGPLTIVSLLQNTLQAYRQHHNL